MYDSEAGVGYARPGPKKRPAEAGGSFFMITPASETIEAGQKKIRPQPLFSFDPFTLVSRLLTLFILYLQFLNV